VFWRVACLIRRSHDGSIKVEAPRSYAVDVSELRVEVPDEVAERLASEAAQRGTSPEDVAAELIVTHAPTARPEPRRPRFVGLGHSGQHDLSERVEDLLDADLGS
jgi:hypothetical protein